MKLYSAVDLHANNHVVAIIDEEDKRVLQKRLPNDLANTLKVLPIKDSRPLPTPFPLFDPVSPFPAAKPFARGFHDTLLSTIYPKKAMNCY